MSKQSNPKSTICPTCMRTGTAQPEASGNSAPLADPEAASEVYTETCPGCMGEGVIENYSCNLCGGRGMIEPEELRRYDADAAKLKSSDDGEKPDLAKADEATRSLKIAYKKIEQLTDDHAKEHKCYPWTCPQLKDIQNHLAYIATQIKLVYRSLEPPPDHALEADAVLKLMEAATVTPESFALREAITNNFGYPSAKVVDAKSTPPSSTSKSSYEQGALDERRACGCDRCSKLLEQG